MTKFMQGATASLAVALLSGAMILGAPRATRASDHQDTPYLAQVRPSADITDVYVFPAADPAKVVLAMDVHPLIPTGLGTSVHFDPGVLYEFKIAHGMGHVEDQVIQFKPTGVGASQTIAFYGPAAPVGGPGTASSLLPQSLGSATYNAVTPLQNGVMVFAGPRKDPFYFDLAQFLKILPDRNYKNHPNPPHASAKCFRTPGQDTLIPYNVLSLVVELPRKMLADRAGNIGMVHVWATTSIAQGGNSRYTQIERLGRPAIKEVFEPFAMHDRTNRTAPTNDALLARNIRSFTIHEAGRSDAIAAALVKTLIPDELAANLAAKGPSRYLAVETNGKSGLPVGIVRIVPVGGLQGIKKGLTDPVRNFGGRDPDSNVIDLSLGSIFGSLLPKLGLAADDHHETPCLTSDHVQPMNRNTKTFPYIGPPV